MRIGFYLGGMSGPGSGAWTRLQSLVASITDSDVALHVYGSEVQLQGFAEHPHVVRTVLPQRGRLRRLRTVSREVRSIVERDRLDFLQFETLPVPRRVPCRTILTIHDLREFHPIGRRGLLERIYDGSSRLAIRQSVKRVNLIVTLTQWSRNDIVKHLGLSPSTVLVVPYGLEPDICSSVFKPGDAVTGSDPERYVLALGHLEKRKNLEVLVRATQAAEWPLDVALVIAGEDHGELRRLHSLLESRPGQVRFLGKVNEETKQRLLSEALCLAMPSFLEGFGIPVLEAIQSGTPALVSDRTALPEVVGVEAAVLPADDPSAWANAVTLLADDDSSRKHLLQEERSAVLRFEARTVGQQYLHSLRNY